MVGTDDERLTDRNTSSFEYYSIDVVPIEGGAKLMLCNARWKLDVYNLVAPYYDVLRCVPAAVVDRKSLGARN